jgi:hypothetical protein
MDRNALRAAAAAQLRRHGVPVSARGVAVAAAAAALAARAEASAAAATAAAAQPTQQPPAGGTVDGQIPAAPATDAVDTDKRTAALAAAYHAAFIRESASRQTGEAAVNRKSDRQPPYDFAESGMCLPELEVLPTPAPPPLIPADSALVRDVERFLSTAAVCAAATAKMIAAAEENQRTVEDLRRQLDPGAATTTVDSHATNATAGSAAALANATSVMANVAGLTERVRSAETAILQLREMQNRLQAEEAAHYARRDAELLPPAFGTP